MSAIGEARMMLDAAEKAGASQALRVGWLTLAKDAISAELNRSKKGEAEDGEVPGQTVLEDYARPVGQVTVAGNGVVLTSADVAGALTAAVVSAGYTSGEATDFVSLEGEIPGEEPEWPAPDPEDRAELPDEATYEALEEHKRHVAANPGLYAEDCVYCTVAASARGLPVTAHERPDTDGEIPQWPRDSRPIPGDGGVQ